MCDLDEERDAYYPFQSGYAPRGSSAPYVVAALALAILAVLSLNIASISDRSTTCPDTQITSESRSAGSSANFN